MKLKIDYKGKHFILQDKELGCMDFTIGSMKDEGITDEFLSEHVANCIYYGIPAYIGGDKELNERVLKFQKAYKNKF